MIKANKSQAQIAENLEIDMPPLLVRFTGWPGSVLAEAR